MQENEFEKTIREKMEQLRLIPNDEVWHKVSEKIRKDKEKRRFLFLLFLFIFLAGASGFYFLNSSNKNLHSLFLRDNSSSAKNTFDKGNDIAPSQEIVAKKGQQSHQQNDEEQTKGISHDEATSKKVASQIEEPVTINAKKEDHILKSKLALIAKRDIEAKSRMKSERSGERLIKEKSAQTTDGSTQPYRPNSSESRTEQPDKKNKSEQQAVLPSDSLKHTPGNIQKVDISIDTATRLLANTKLIEKPKIQDKKNWKVGLTVFGGMSDNLTDLASSGNGSLNYTNGNPNSSSAGQSNSPIRKLSYNSSFSYSIGVFALKSFSRKISFSTGVNYHFFSAISPAGTKISTPQTVYDASLQSSAFVNQVYSSGQSVDYKNKYELLELPINFLLQLNRNENKKLFLTAGITPAYLVGSRALYASTTQNLYYETNEQFKKILLLVQSGVQFSILQSRRFEIMTGPQIQYGVNNMAKSATGTSQHLSSASLKVNIILK